MPEPEVTYSVQTRHLVIRSPADEGSTVVADMMDLDAAYGWACHVAEHERDRRSYPPGDDRIQWPAIPAGVYIPPVPAPEAA